MKSKSIISGLLITVITSCFTTAFANYPIPRYENGDYLYYQENMDIKNQHANEAYPFKAMFGVGHRKYTEANYNELWDISKKTGEAGTNVHNYSDATRRFTIEGRHFLLLDTDEVGNFFVIADELYGNSSLLSGLGNNDAYKQAVMNGEFRFDTQYPKSIANWLNSTFYNNGSTIKLPESIKPYIMEHEWWTEPGVNVVDPGYYVEKFGDENTVPLNGYLSYSTTCKIALLSLYEYGEYFDIISPLCYGKSGNSSGAWNQDSWFLRTVQNAELFTNGNGMSELYISTKSGRVATANGYNPFGVRPCFWLDKDFFKEVKLDEDVPQYKLSYTDEESQVSMPVAMGDYIKELVKSTYAKGEMGIYTDAIPESFFGYSEFSPLVPDDLSIEGKLTVGETITAEYTYGYESEDEFVEEGNTKIQWYRDDEPIDGATEKQYILTEYDIGSKISVEVRCVDEYGNMAPAVKTEKTTAVLEKCPFNVQFTGINKENGLKISFTLDTEDTVSMIVGMYDENGKLVDLNVFEGEDIENNTVNIEEFKGVVAKAAIISNTKTLIPYGIIEIKK